MKVYPGFALFAALSCSWAQTSTVPRPAAKKSAPAAKKTASSNKKLAPPAPAKASKIEEGAMKMIKAISAKYSALQNYQLAMSIDSGRQVDEEARQALAKAEVKMIVAPQGKYSLEVIEGADDKPSYKVVSDGARKWTHVAELKQFRETATAPTKPISAAESEPGEPLASDEPLAERLSRQVIPLLANIDKTTENAFLRGRLLTLMSKPDAEGHGTLLYLSLATEDGEINQLSWYVSSGPADHRMLMRTDFVVTALKTLDSVPASEFTFSPSPDTKAFVASAATAEQHQ
jgi:hypothetical protein